MDIPAIRMKQTILVVDDEPDVVDLVRYNIQKADGMSVITANNGMDALRIARKVRPDAIVLDVMMPEMDGFNVCKELRADNETTHIPLIMLTAKDQQEDKINGLEIGADDYLTKPFSPKELVLRVKSLLKRTAIADSSSVIVIGPFELDKTSFKFRLNGRAIELTTTEFKLLSLLIEKRGKILSRETLLQEVWGYHNPIDTRTVDTHMRRLRAKLEDHVERIETVRGEGYRFSTEGF